MTAPAEPLTLPPGVVVSRRDALRLYRAAGWPIPAPPTTVLLTYFPDISGHTATRCEVAWPRLLDRLANLPRQSVKERAPLISGALFGDIQTAKGSLRHDANVEGVSMILGDHDAGTVTPAEAVARLEHHHIRAAVVTTWSHARAHPRWRPICPLSRTVPPSEFRRLIAGLNGALGGCLGVESFALSRAYFIGGRPGGEYEVRVTFDDPDEGIALDQWDALDEVAIYPPAPERPAPTRQYDPAEPKGSRYIAAAVEAECLELATAPKGTRNTTLNRAAWSLARFVAAGEADAEAVVDALTIAATHAGLPAHEIQKTIQSAFGARQVAA